LGKDSIVAVVNIGRRLKGTKSSTLNPPEVYPPWRADKSWKGERARSMGRPTNLR